MTRTISTDRLHKIIVYDFQDALGELNRAEPADPSGYTPQAITTLLSHLSVCEGYLRQMQRLAEQQATCQPCPTYTPATRRAAHEAIEQREAMREMANDIGPAGWEFWWERS